MNAVLIMTGIHPFAFSPSIRFSDLSLLCFGQRFNHNRLIIPGESTQPHRQLLSRLGHCSLVFGFVKTSPCFEQGACSMACVARIEIDASGRSLLNVYGNVRQHHRLPLLRRHAAVTEGLDA